MRIGVLKTTKSDTKDVKNDTPPTHETQFEQMGDSTKTREEIIFTFVVVLHERLLCPSYLQILGFGAPLFIFMMTCPFSGWSAAQIGIYFALNDVGG